MILIDCTGVNGMPISIPAKLITGIIGLPEEKHKAWGKCFVCTGADSADGGENGFYVTEDHRIMKNRLAASVED